MLDHNANNALQVYKTNPALVNNPLPRTNRNDKDKLANEEDAAEEEMLERTNCEIWGYDFSVDQFGPAIQNAYSGRTHFLKAGISGSTEPNKDPPFYTIQDLMSTNGHTYM